MKTRTFLAVILVGIQPALGNTTWQGDQGDSWHETFNWSSGVPDATDTAFFGTVAAGNSIKPRLFIPGVYDVGTINFTAGAPAFTITVDHTPFVQNVVLNVVGGGIINSSSNTQSIMNAGEVGTDSAGMTTFRNNATAGSNVVITNLPPLVSGGFGARTEFYNNSVAGSATISNRGNGLLSPFGGSTGFFDNASASNATINNLRGSSNTSTQFNENSTAGNAHIVNQGALEPSGFSQPGRGATLFSSTSDAGTATITNEGGIGMNGVGGIGGGTTFSGTASANSAVILNSAGTDAGDGGRTAFAENSTAGDATITSNGAVGLNNGAGFVTFSATSDAGTASITTGGGGAFGSGATATFSDTSSAANASLVTNGGSLGGAGGQTLFTGSASGGEAVVTTNAGGTFSISGLTTVGTTVGSIAGAGKYVLGAKNLIVGLGFAGAFADTTVSGVISGTDGSLTKSGIGALTLSGANTYTGGTFLNAGRLSIDHNAGLGTGTLQIFGGILGSHVANTTLANNITVSGDFTISPPSGLFAQLQLAGDVNIGATTHVIHPENSNFATFSGRLLGTTAGVSFNSSGSVDGNFILSGSASNAYSGITTVEGNLLNNGSVQLLLAKTGGAIALPANVTINTGGTVTLIEDEQIADTARVVVNSGGVFRVNAHIERISTLNGNGSVVLSDSSAGGTLIVGSGDFDGAITDGGLAGQLVKTGPGTLILSRGSSYTGGTRSRAASSRLIIHPAPPPAQAPSSSSPAPASPGATPPALSDSSADRSPSRTPAGSSPD
jgi:autotransporter-associated beta strand protein